MPAPHHSVLQAGCPSLPPNQQRQSTEGHEMLENNKNKKITNKNSRQKL